ncbi:hypothetical protein CEXT_800941 [Caerostris extrusa]|uniref:Uncharacterized protein n=1 Tax=Caerostris extrusa TaxID=172846 RepID=A0AAV4XFW9_CAEEX|nr:hypothetical protein CEXT_800941 [Caerostris extrusa]
MKFETPNSPSPVLHPINGTHNAFPSNPPTPPCICGEWFIRWNVPKGTQSKVPFRAEDVPSPKFLSPPSSFVYGYPHAILLRWFGQLLFVDISVSDTP